MTKDFQDPDQKAELKGYRVEHYEGFDWVSPKDVKFLTYYPRHAKALANVMRFVKDPVTAVQAGGHCGAYPRWLGQHFRAVHTFEPERVLFPSLAFNTRDLPRVRAYNAYLGNQPKPNRFPLLRIDDLRLTELSLLALDIEGDEYQALLGAERTIIRCRPVLLVEEAPVEHNQPEWLAKYQEACELMSSWDYEMLENERCGPDRIWVPR